MVIPTREEILETDFDPSFVKLMEEGIVSGFRKWGPVEQYLQSEMRGGGRRPTIQSYLDDVARYLAKFKETRDIRNLAHAANHLMFLYMRAMRNPETIIWE